MILALKTDGPTAEIVAINADGSVIDRMLWLAERRLARELLAKLEAFLASIGYSWKDVDGLVVYRGPGSFTGLRIGITVMNTAAYAQSIPIVGATGEQWFVSGYTALRSGHNDRIVLPEYGELPRITLPKK